MTNPPPRRARRFHALYAVLTETAYPELPAHHTIPGHLMGDVHVPSAPPPDRARRRYRWLSIQSVLTSHFTCERPHS